MELFRLAPTRYVKDLAGTGARQFGGRWNPPGTPVVYTSESRSLAVLEYLIHMPLEIAPLDLSMLRVEVPDGIRPHEVDPSSLPPDWEANPPPSALAAIGAEWVRSMGSLLLRVPSVIVEQECNILINPAHPDFRVVTPSPPEPFLLDRRLLARRRA